MTESVYFNPECDGVHCTADDGEVRLLPLSNGANLLLCRACFDYEMNFNRQHGDAVADWNTLKAREGRT